VPFAILLITSGFLQQVSQAEVVTSEDRPFADANEEEKQV